MKYVNDVNRFTRIPATHPKICILCILGVFMPNMADNFSYGVCLKCSGDVRLNLFKAL